jgi:hypothetical protein
VLYHLLYALNYTSVNPSFSKQKKKSLLLLHFQELEKMQGHQKLKVLAWDHFSLYQRAADSDTKCLHKMAEEKAVSMLPRKKWAEG